MNRQVFVRPGVFYTKAMPCSEVCMSMRISGKAMGLVLTHLGMVQLFEVMDTEMTHPWSSPITPGEAGLYWDESKRGYYFWRDEFGGTVHDSEVQS